MVSRRTEKFRFAERKKGRVKNITLPAYFAKVIVKLSATLFEKKFK